MRKPFLPVLHAVGFIEPIEREDRKASAGGVLSIGDQNPPIRQLDRLKLMDALVRGGKLAAVYPEIGCVANPVQRKLPEAAPACAVPVVGDCGMAGVAVREYILAIAENRTRGERRKFRLVIPFGKGTRVVPEE